MMKILSGWYMTLLGRGKRRETKKGEETETEGKESEKERGTKKK